MQGSISTKNAEKNESIVKGSTKINKKIKHRINRKIKYSFINRKIILQLKNKKFKQIRIFLDFYNI